MSANARSWGLASEKHQTGIRTHHSVYSGVLRDRRIGRSKAYELINAGDVETIRIGQRQFVVLASFYRLIEKQLAAKRDNGGAEPALDGAERRKPKAAPPTTDPPPPPSRKRCR